MVKVGLTRSELGPEPDSAVVGNQVKGHQGGAAAVVFDFVVDLFKSPWGPRHRHDMRAGLCERARGGIADAARGAGDESDAGGEGWGHSSNFSCVVPANAGTHTP